MQNNGSDANIIRKTKIQTTLSIDRQLMIIRNQNRKYITLKFLKNVRETSDRVKLNMWQKHLLDNNIRLL